MHLVGHDQVPDLVCEGFFPFVTACFTLHDKSTRNELEQYATTIGHPGGTE